MPEQAQTATQVKTKTVSKAQMALALAFLGVSAIAAAALTLTPATSGNQLVQPCADSDYATTNAAGMPMAVYQYVNLGQKGVATGLSSNGKSMAGEDKCWNNTRILEYFCNLKNNTVSWNSYNCPTGTNCVDGACVAPFAAGQMNFQVLSSPLKVKLFNGSNDLGGIAVSALDESITLNSLKFTFFVINGQYGLTTLSDLYLTEYKDGSSINIAGPVNLVPDQTTTGTYYAAFDNLNLVLPAYSQGLVNWSKKLQLTGNVLGVMNGSFVGVRINPAKDIVGTGAQSKQKISPTFDQLVTVSDLVY